MNVQDLVERYVVASLEKQFALGEVIGDANWSANLDKGTITFGSKYQFPVQVLGSEADQPKTWLWAWANAASNIPARLLACANDLKAFGTREAISELTTSEMSLSKIDGHRLAIIASGLCNAACYYRGPYDGGAVFLIIPDAPPVNAKLSSTPERLINIFSQAIQTMPFNHRHALAAFLEYKGYSVNATNTGIDAKNKQNQVIHAEFDSANRLTKLDVL